MIQVRSLRNDLQHVRAADGSPDFSGILFFPPSLCATRRCDDSQAVFTSRTRTPHQKKRRSRNWEPVIYSPSIRILKPMSLHLCPDARQTTRMEVSIVALICIHSTLSSPLQFGGVSSQQRQQMRRVSDQDLRFSSRVGAKKRREGGGGTKKRMFRHFLLCFGGAVSALTDCEGRREARRSSSRRAVHEK